MNPYKNKENNEDERRRYPREQLTLPVIIFSDKGKKQVEQIHGETVDISPYGIAIKSESSLHDNENGKLSVDIVSPFKRASAHPVAARLVRQLPNFQNHFALELIDPPSYMLAPSLVGKSPAICNIKEKLVKIAASGLNTLITGESGTGKNCIAEIIHRYSARKNAPFIRVNCPSIPDTLFEAQLFGTRKGAYTGSDSDKPGLIRMADGGTLLLDEISSIPLSLQAKLLQVVEEKRFYPVGASESIRVDCRIIACTNADMDDIVSKGEFRDDLYYRLAEAQLKLPPLRERKEDIALLADYFQRLYCYQNTTPYQPIAPSIIERLEAPPWPGNVRQLEQTIRRGVLLDDYELSSETQVDRKSSNIDSAVPPDSFPQKTLPRKEDSLTLEHAVKLAEEAAIISALNSCGQNKVQASELLEVSYRTLQRKIRHHGIKKNNNEPPDTNALTYSKDKNGTPLPLRKVAENAEQNVISNVIDSTDGDLTTAASILNVSYSTLLRKKNKLGI